MATRGFTNTNVVYDKIGAADTPCMLITPGNIAQKLSELGIRIRVLNRTTFEIKHLTEKQYTEFITTALDEAKRTILPLLQEANQAGQVFIFSVSASQYIQPYDITDITKEGVIVEIRAGQPRRIGFETVCSDFQVRDDILACRRLLEGWGLKYNIMKDRNTIVLELGQDTGIMAVKVTPQGYNQWNEIVTNHELPITFTLIEPNGTYYYIYRYRPMLFLGSGDFPGIHLLYLSTDVIPAPCSEDFDIAEGLDENDQLIIADIPDWLYNVFRAEAGRKTYGNKNLTQLRDLVRRYNLPTTGTREDLLQRLMEKETNDMMATLARRTFT